MLPKVAQSPTSDDFVRNPTLSMKPVWPKEIKSLGDYKMVSLLSMICFQYSKRQEIWSRMSREKKQDHRGELAPFYELKPFNAPIRTA